MAGRFVGISLVFFCIFSLISLRDSPHVGIVGQPRLSVGSSVTAQRLSIVKYIINRHENNRLSPPKRSLSVEMTCKEVARAKEEHALSFAGKPLT